LARILVAAGVVWALSVPPEARAEVLVRIDKSTQRMTVSVDGMPQHVWPVSTGRAGFGTPNGHFRPQRLARSWFSRKYYNSPMPHSIFFHRGYAIHGTNYLRQLGGIASHGCVRLAPRNAATLFALVQRHGQGNTRIVVTGANPTQIARRPNAPRRAAQRPYGASPYYEGPGYRVQTAPTPYPYYYAPYRQYY
jgi:hypothetical protein